MKNPELADRLRLLILVSCIAWLSILHVLVASWYGFHPLALDDYISDEVWYVSSARNILYLMGLQPRPCSICNLTLFYPDIEEARACAPGGLLLTKAVAVVTSCGLTKDLHATETRCCFSYPDEADIHKYLNTEHPPIAKYIVALEMFLAGDCPLYWRVAPTTLSYLAVVSTLLVLHILAVRKRFTLGAYMLTLLTYTALITTLIHSSLYATATIAILEPFATGFGCLALLAYTLGYRRVAFILATLATLSKYTGVVYLAALVAAERFSGKLRSLAGCLIIAIATALVAYAPLAYKLGPAKLMEDTVGGLNWFLESRPPGGPPPSTPLDWLTGGASFTLSYEPNITAKPNHVVLASGFAASIILAILAPMEPLAVLLATPTPLFLLLMTIVYLAGNRTLYAFYTAVVEPVAAASFAALAATLYEKGLQPFKEALRLWPKTPEYKLLKMLVSRDALPFVAAIAALAIGGWGEAPGLLSYVKPLDRVSWVALTASLALVALSSCSWRRVSKETLTASILGFASGASALTLLALTMCLTEIPALTPLAVLLIPSITLIPLARGWAVLAAAAVYTASRLTGLAPPPSMYELTAALVTAAFSRLGALYTPYAALALVDDRLAYVALALVSRHPSAVLPAMLTALSTRFGQPLSTLLKLPLLAYTIVTDAKTVAKHLKRLKQRSGRQQHSRETMLQQPRGNATP